MQRLFITALVILPLAGCADLVTRRADPGPDLRFGTGYRGTSDPCKRVGRSEFTAAYVESENDLVGCPIDFPGRSEFQVKTGGREVKRTDHWVLYRVPLLGAPEIAPPVDMPAPAGQL